MKISVFNGVILIFIIIITFLVVWNVDNIHPSYEKPSDINSSPLRLVFVGDVMLSRHVGDIITRKGPEFPFEHVHDILIRGDITMGNLESPISSLNSTVCEKRSTSLWNLCFKASPDSVRGLTYAGFDIMTMANNHALDYKPEIMNDTLIRLTAAGIKYTGVQQSGEEYLPNATIVQDPRMKVAFLGFNDIGTYNNSSYPRPWNATEEIVIQAVKKARVEGDIVVVNFHFGEQWNFTPSQRQETLAHLAADSGATIIIGHHSHVIQKIEIYNRSIIAYSLGNFIFDMGSAGDREGAILTVEIDPDTEQIAGYSFDKVTSNNEFQPRPGVTGMIISNCELIMAWSFSKLNSITAKNVGSASYLNNSING
jgi:poly-gamma-glutamate synthesis protein (capsule biosynthesis protein)